MEQLFYACLHKDVAVEKKSSSGGAFTAITDAWFDCYGENAVVYGCAFDENLNAKHIRAASKSERDRMRGSKYIASDVSGIYKSVADDLLHGNYVAFSGTPCQISALLKYLNNNAIEAANQLLTIEVICNGVADNGFFKDYIAHLEKRYKGKAISCNFRGKSSAGASTRMEIDFDNGKRYRASSTRYDWFYSLYYKNYITKKACFNCQFATLDRQADISIGDMKADGVDSKKKSLVIANTLLGKIWAERALLGMSSEKVALEQIDQPRLYAPAEKAIHYEAFWDVYNQRGYLAAQKYVGNNTAKSRLKVFCVNLLGMVGIVSLLSKIRNVMRKR